MSRTKIWLVTVIFARCAQTRKDIVPNGTGVLNVSGKTSDIGSSNIRKFRIRGKNNLCVQSGVAEASKRFQRKSLRKNVGKVLLRFK